jgi:EAL domain-containing protein (putative c-di-GMP-specific phosphodiesterase class I)
LRIKRKPILSILCLLIGVAALFGVDWMLADGARVVRAQKLTSAVGSFMSDVDRKLNQVRDTLGSLDASRVTSCSPGDVAARADAILAVPQLKGLAVYSSDGTQSCSSLPLSIAPVPEFSVDAVDLSSFERLDVVSLGPSGRLALRLRHKPANSTSTLTAVVPLSELATWLNRSPDSIFGKAHLRLMLGKRILLDMADDRADDGTGSSVTPANLDEATSEATATGNQLTATAISASYPLSLIAFAQRLPSEFDSRRILTDVVLLAAFCGLMAIMLFRDPEQDFISARFAQALRRKEFDVAYRPVIDLHSGMLGGAIVEMRWRRGGGVVLSSTDFMPAVVRSGFEPQLLRYALIKCQEDLSAAYKLRVRLQLKVPIDHETLIQPGFIDLLRRSLAASSLRPSQLAIAIHPIRSSADADRFRVVLKDLQRLGIQLQVRQSTGEIAFGSGPDDATASAIGIDYRLTRALDAGNESNAEQARGWIRDIVATCKSSGVRVCAYHLTSYKALKQLKELGVEEVEGSVLAPALTAGSFLALVARAGLDKNDGASDESTSAMLARRA